MHAIEIRTGEAPDVEAFLLERIYAHNAAATGYADAESFHALLKDQSGRIVGGICGYTWGGCCHISYLWVAQAERHVGHGSALLNAVERHARGKNCRMMWLSTHTFQAPGFYPRRGYEQIARIDGHPRGHASLLYVKHLANPLGAGPVQ